jgi:hypothetical protein
MSTIQEILNRAVYYSGNKELLEKKEELIQVTNWDKNLARTELIIKWMEKSNVRWVILKDNKFDGHKISAFYALFLKHGRPMVEVTLTEIGGL